MIAIPRSMLVLSAELKTKTANGWLPFGVPSKPSKQGTPQINSHLCNVGSNPKGKCSDAFMPSRAVCVHIHTCVLLFLIYIYIYSYTYVYVSMRVPQENTA